MENSFKSQKLENNSREESELFNLRDINSLPSEILIRIFNQFGQKELAASVGPVCKKWYKIVHEIPSAWKCAIVSNFVSREAAVQYLNKHPGLLKKIQFVLRDDMDLVLREVSVAVRQRIVCLEFYLCLSEINTIEKIAKQEIPLPNLRKLRFFLNKNESERYLCILPKMSLKKLSAWSFDDVNLEDFSALCVKGLITFLIEHVQLNEFPRNLEEENVKFQQGLQKIEKSCERLGIFTKGVTDSTVELISRMKQLKGLHLSITSLISQEYFDKLKNLEHLRFLSVHDGESRISEEVWVEFLRSARFGTILEKLFLYKPAGLSNPIQEIIKENCPRLERLLVLNSRQTFDQDIDLYSFVRDELFY